MSSAIIVHGGAGPVPEERLPGSLEGCERAAAAGWRLLADGGSALEAVEAAVRVLEDDPEFNAGYGAVLNHDGEVEVDAAVMLGDLRVGAVGALPWVRHPVTVARRLLEAGEHVLLVGDGARRFAAEHGILPEAPERLVTPRSRARWQEERRRDTERAATGDTVGACALDREGNLAAATSTGGLSSKRPGRVGDSPLPGAGTYAEAGAGAASATGHGESIIRVLMTKAAVDRLRCGASPAVAAAEAVADLGGRVAGQGGIILIDPVGRVGQARNTERMPWAAVVDGAATRGS